MKSNKKIYQLVLAAVLALSITGCSLNTTTNSTTTTDDTVVTTTQTTSETTASSETTVMETLKDLSIDSSYEESEATIILADDSGFSVTGSGATAEANAVTITEKGTYIISGSIDDGQIIVNTEDKVQLVLNGLTITSTTSAPIYIMESEEVTITLAEGTTNTVSDTTSFTYSDATNEEPDATIFSKGDLIFNGTGTLVVNSNFNHAIVSKDSLTLAEGNFEITTVGDALNANDTLSVVSGNYTIAAGDDGFHSDTYLVFYDGNVNITESVEGLEAGIISIQGGTISLVSSDDGINATTDDTSIAIELQISGGSVTVNAQGDGLDSNGSITMTGGEVIVYGPTNSGNGALDYNSTFNISGGTLIAAGSAGMAQSASDSSTQSVLYVVFNQVQAAGTTYTIKDAVGNEILSVTPEKEYQTIIVSSSSLQQGETYTLYSDTTELTTVTLSSTLTSISSDGSQTSAAGNMGGGMGGEMGTEMPGNMEGGKGGGMRNIAPTE